MHFHDILFFHIWWSFGGYCLWTRKFRADGMVETVNFLMSIEKIGEIYFCIQQSNAFWWVETVREFFSRSMHEWMNVPRSVENELNELVEWGEHFLFVRIIHDFHSHTMQFWVNLCPFLIEWWSLLRFLGIFCGYHLWRTKLRADCGSLHENQRMNLFV